MASAYYTVRYTAHATIANSSYLKGPRDASLWPVLVLSIVASASYSRCQHSCISTTMFDEDERLPSPPPKRRCARAMDPSSSSMGAFAQQAQSPFWMTDGDFILRVEGVLFKVHHRSLSKSEIFGDMMAMPQPCDAECIDGCPLVELADSAQDWLVALRWMSDEE